MEAIPKEEVLKGEVNVLQQICRVKVLGRIGFHEASAVIDIYDPSGKRALEWYVQLSRTAERVSPEMIAIYFK